jgi:SAM-dependent methyltransferase
MVDWGAGNYEWTAAELEPASVAVVDLAAIHPGEEVVDLGCGTGNAALIAAARGARVTGVDGAPRLLEIASGRAQSLGVEVEFCEGDLLALPLDDQCVDVALSVFGVIFARDPPRALGEVRRVLRPDGRALISAWIPSGPIHAMLGAMREVHGRVTQQAPPRRLFAWSEADAVRELARDAGLALESTTVAELEIRAASAEAYVDGGAEHPMHLLVRPTLERAGAAQEARDAMVAAVRQANEDDDAFLVHSPYVVHLLLPV